MFLITGGAVWSVLMYVYMFSDDIEVPFDVRDPDEEVRIITFYDVPYEKDDGETSPQTKIRNEQTESVVFTKEVALYHALDLVKQHKKVNIRLGTPVQFSGYRVAPKLGRMMKQFQNMSDEDVENYVCEGSINGQKMWSTECLLEGPKGLASVKMDFERVPEKKEWVLTKVLVDVLVSAPGDHLLELDGVLPDGVEVD